MPLLALAVDVTRSRLLPASLFRGEKGQQD